MHESPTSPLGNSVRESRGDKRRDGTINTGTRNGGSKITDEQVAEIRAAVAAGRSQRSVSVEYGLSNQHVSRIINRKKWAHL